MTGGGQHTFTVTVDEQSMADRQLEKIDWAVEILRGIRGVSVEGWCDDE